MCACACVVMVVDRPGHHVWWALPVHNIMVLRELVLPFLAISSLVREPLFRHYNLKLMPYVLSFLELASRSQRGSAQVLYNLKCDS